MFVDQDDKGKRQWGLDCCAARRTCGLTSFIYISESPDYLPTLDLHSVTVGNSFAPLVPCPYSERCTIARLTLKFVHPLSRLFISRLTESVVSPPPLRALPHWDDIAQFISGLPETVMFCAAQIVHRDWSPLLVEYHTYDKKVDLLARLTLSRTIDILFHLLGIHSCTLNGSN